MVVVGLVVVGVDVTGDLLGLADGLVVVGLVVVGVDVTGDLLGLAAGAILGLSEVELDDGLSVGLLFEFRSQTVVLYVVVVREAHPSLVELKNPNNFHVGRIDVV